MIETKLWKMTEVVKTILPALTPPPAPNLQPERQHPVIEGTFNQTPYSDPRLKLPTPHSIIRQGEPCNGGYLKGQRGQKGMHQQASYPSPFQDTTNRETGPNLFCEKHTLEHLPYGYRADRIIKSLADVVDLTHHTPTLENAKMPPQPTDRPDMDSLPTLAPQEQNILTL